MKDVLHGIVLDCIIDFIDTESYLYTGPVSSTWNEAWGTRDKKTRCITKYTTLNQLDYAIQNGKNKNTICEQSSLLARPDLFERALSHGCPLGQSKDFAFKTGDMKMIKKLSNLFPRDDLGFVRAIKHPHEHVLDWLSSKRGCDNIHAETLFYMAISCNNVIGIEWLVKNGHFKPGTRLNGACHSGINAEMLGWLKKNSIHLTSTQVGFISRYASYTDDLEVLKWLVENSYNVDFRCIEGGAHIGGSSNVIYWLLTI